MESDSEQKRVKNVTTETRVWNTTRMDRTEYEGACRTCGLFVCLHRRRDRR